MDPDPRGCETPSQSAKLAQMEAVGFDPMSNEVNMTNCYKHLEDFFSQCESLHFNMLIAYWMMAGYLGPVDSVGKSYRKGHEILMELMYKDQVLEPAASGEGGNMVKLSTSTDSNHKHCKHKGLCSAENVDLFDLSKLHEIGEVIFSDGILENKKGSLLILDGENSASSRVFHSSKRLKYLAYFNPSPGTSLKTLLQDANKLSLLLIRGADILIDTNIPPEAQRSLSVVEISCSSHKGRCELEVGKFSNLHCLVLRGIHGFHTGIIPERLMVRKALHFSHCSFNGVHNFFDMSQLLYLNLSGFSRGSLPDRFFSGVRKLRWLIIRESHCLEQLPSIKDLNDLEVLDVSHCTSLRDMKSHIIDVPQLQMVDLSYTLLDRVPYPRDSPKFTHLLLRNTKIRIPFCISELTSLKVLDLSGSNDLQEVHLSEHYDLVVLDLSGTRIKSLGSVPEMVNLRKLAVRGCASLEELPIMTRLPNLEVLDISGCKQLITFPILSNLTKLEVLDLSETDFKGLPLFSNPISLGKLSLCGLELDTLETLASLSSLVELDLGNVKISTSQEFKADFLQYLHSLQVLNLSGTAVAKLPTLSSMVDLKELILADCMLLKALPDLSTFKNLEVLDLSISDDLIARNRAAEVSEDMEMLPPHLLPSSLRKLELRNRAGMHKLFPLTTPSKLEFLDLRVTDVRKIPDLKLAQVKCTRLLGTIDMSGIQLGRMGKVHGEIVCNGNTSEPAEIQVVPSSCNRYSLSVKADQFFHLQSNRGSWEAFVNQFSVSNCPEELEKGVLHAQGDEFFFKSWPATFLNHELEGRSVEFHGFSQVLELIQKPIHQAKNIALIGNDFPSSLLELCSEAVKLYCIKNCPEIESVFGKEGDEKCPEVLVLSDLLGLKCISHQAVKPKTTALLKHVYIDFCSQLGWNAHLETLENLETLHVRFCEKLPVLFSDGSSLPKLQKLNLFELPNLIHVNTDLPSLRTMSIGQCPKVNDVDVVIRSARKSLEMLHLDSCPGLKHVLPSSDAPEKLRALRVKSCNGVVTLFGNDGDSSSTLPQLHSLENLTLSNLAKLESIGDKLASKLNFFELPELLFAADLPSLSNLSISECPNVNNLDWIIKSARASLEQLFLSCCPRLEHALPSADVPEKLRTLRISFCRGLVTLFDIKSGASSSSLPKLHGLETLRLMDLPKLKSIGGELSSVKSIELDGSLPADVLQQLTTIQGAETDHVAP